jgi:hypothetical protein
MVLVILVAPLAILPILLASGQMLLWEVQCRLLMEMVRVLVMVSALVLMMALGKAQALC